MLKYVTNSIKNYLLESPSDGSVMVVDPPFMLMIILAFRSFSRLLKGLTRTATLTFSSSAILTMTKGPFEAHWPIQFCCCSGWHGDRPNHWRSREQHRPWVTFSTWKANCIWWIHFFYQLIHWLYRTKYDNDLTSHCLKITLNVAFEFLNFGIFHQFLSY